MWKKIIFVEYKVSMSICLVVLVYKLTENVLCVLQRIVQSVWFQLIRG